MHQAKIEANKEAPQSVASLFAQRTGRDSNPRYAFCAYTGLANQRLRPLGHLSKNHQHRKISGANSVANCLHSVAFVSRLKERKKAARTELHTSADTLCPIMLVLHLLSLTDPAFDAVWPWIQQELPRLFTQLDGFLLDLVHAVGAWTYLVLFLIVFCETGLVVIPFLPGDSLLFAAGAVCAVPDSPVHIGFMAPLLFAAALLGDNLNYRVGRFVGPRAFSGGIRFLNPTHLAKTQQFFAKHGGKSVVLARFVPIVRTFAPFVAGVGVMRYRTFIGFSLLGAAMWVGLFMTTGWAFGNMPWVKNNFSKVILLIILISLLPIAWEWWKHRTSLAQQKNRDAP